ncbi:MAG: hydroxymethylglutaryl-CoA synthase family protein [Gemmatimonadaceae bacterium]|nr:hydroxymethylglutaryl-CoA synthase family protein [Gemmatimonadaceae bacterium]
MSAGPVGIEGLGVDVGTLALDIGQLCDARGLDADNFVRRLHCRERTVLSPFDDVVTLAVNAARRLVTPVTRPHIRWLMVATESAIDQEKPVSSWVHRLLDLPSDCRNFEVKHACYGATAAVQVARRLVVSDPDPDARVLVINADHALLGLHGVQEPVLGAGAAAVLISRHVQLAEFEGAASGVFAHETADIFRPAPGVETGDAETSLASYLDGVAETYADYERKWGAPIDFERHFAAHIYHVPFGGLAERAHMRLAQQALGLSRTAAREHWARKSAPSLRYTRRLGGIYGASTFVALAALLAEHPPAPGARVGVYAYGSGSCAEFYGMRTTASSQRVAQALHIDAALDARRALSIAEYEACELALHGAMHKPAHVPVRAVLPGLYETHYAGTGRLVLRGIRDYVREYAWS